MKTGRPGYHLPSPETVSRDVKGVFVHVRKRIAKMLKVPFSITIGMDSLTHQCSGI